MLRGGNATFGLVILVTGASGNVGSALLGDTFVEVSRAYRHGGVERVTSAVRDLTGRAAVSFAEFVRANRATFLPAGVNVRGIHEEEG
jgi:hypothetical protein